MLRKRGFTLVELLTVLAIMAILSSMLFPSLAKAREGGRRASCSSNLRQIGLAMAQYTEDYDERYPLMTNFKPVPAEEPIANGCPAIYQVAVSWAYALDPYTKNDQIFICPSVSELVENPTDNLPEFKIEDPCQYPGGGGGGGGFGPHCPPPPKVSVPQPTYGVNTMLKYDPAWSHTPGFEKGQGIGQAHIRSAACPTSLNPPGSESRMLSHDVGTHAAAVLQPSETILAADAATKDGKAPQKVNFTNDLELDYAQTPPTGSEELTADLYLSKRHLGGYNALFADGHTKFLPYGSSHPQQWTVEED